MAIPRDGVEDNQNPTAPLRHGPQQNRRAIGDLLDAAMAAVVIVDAYGDDVFYRQ
jgi:hypothetical protein